MDESRSESEKSKEASETRIRELKAALKQSQLDREKLNQEINSMIRVKQSDQESKLLSMQEESAALVQTLKSENADLKQKAKQINRQLENKCEEMVQYEGEIKALKVPFAVLIIITILLKKRKLTMSYLYFYK